MNGFLRLPDGRIVNVANIEGVQERHTANTHGCIIQYLQGGRTLLTDTPVDLVWQALGQVAATAALTADAVLSSHESAAEPGPVGVGT